MAKKIESSIQKFATPIIIFGVITIVAMAAISAINTNTKKVEQLTVGGVRVVKGYEHFCGDGMCSMNTMPPASM